MPKPGVVTGTHTAGLPARSRRYPGGRQCLHRAATPGCRSAIGPPPGGRTHPEPLPACAAAGLVRTRSSVDPSPLDGYLREFCQQCWLPLLASMQLRDLLQLEASRLAAAATDAGSRWPLARVRSAW